MASQNPNLPAPESFICPIPNCKKVYTKRRALHGHFKAHSTKFRRSGKQIKMPAATTSTNINVDDDEDSAAVVSYDCPRCPRTFTRSQALYGHLKCHPGKWRGFCKKNMLVIKFYTCLRCWKSFLLRQVINVKRDEATENANESTDGSDEEREKAPAKTKFFYCFRCKKKLKYRRRRRNSVHHNAENITGDHDGEELKDEELVGVAVAGLMMLLQRAAFKLDLNKPPPQEQEEEEESRRVFKFDLNKPFEE